jgi:hypothetical protein
MARAQIVDAKFGDETSTTNITDSLKAKLSGGSIDVPVDSGLLPFVEVGKKVELTIEEQNQIRGQAQQACNGGLDKACVERQTQELTVAAIKEKENAANTTRDIVKGRRLTVTIRDELGKERTLIYPEGQQFTLGKPGGNAPRELANARIVDESSWKFPTITGTIAQALKIGGIALGSFLYVFSVVSTWMAFGYKGYSQVFVALVMITSVVIPFSGFLITFVFYAFREWKRTKELLSTM